MPKVTFKNPLQAIYPDQSFTWNDYIKQIAQAYVAAKYKGILSRVSYILPINMRTNSVVLTLFKATQLYGQPASSCFCSRTATWLWLVRNRNLGASLAAAIVSQDFSSLNNYSLINCQYIKYGNFRVLLLKLLDQTKSLLLTYIIIMMRFTV